MSLRDKVFDSINKQGVAILPPMDVFDSINLLKTENIHVECTMLDPWYNKGKGDVLSTDEYDSFIYQLLNGSGEISDLLYLWGFPEIIGPYVRYAPKDFYMVSWLTWYYNNCPSVIRGWRSSQNACIQFMRRGHSLHPEHFLNETQKEKFASGKMRFVPGPPSVIEAPLIIGFVEKKNKLGIRHKNLKLSLISYFLWQCQKIKLFLTRWQVRERRVRLLSKMDLRQFFVIKVKNISLYLKSVWALNVFYLNRKAVSVDLIHIIL